TSSFFGTTTAQSSGSTTPLGAITQSGASGYGATLVGIASGQADPFGRPTTSTAVGGAYERLSNYSWQGPQTVRAPDGTTTTYTYGTTEIDGHYLDGALKSVSGTAVTANPTPTPSTTPTATNYDEGVNSNGDTWTKAIVGGSASGPNWTKTYTNILGQQYKT